MAADLSALSRDGIQPIRVEGPARDIGTMKGSFHLHFNDLSHLHQVKLELWEEHAAKAVTGAVNTSGLDGHGQLMLLIDRVSVRPAEIHGGTWTEPVLRDWGSSDPCGRAVNERVDRRRMSHPPEFLRTAGVVETELLPKAQLIYAAVIGLKALRLTTGDETGPPLRALVARLIE